VPVFHFDAPARRPANPTSVQVAAELLRTAKRPLIWSGHGVIQAGASQELTKLAEMWGAGVITSVARRGALPEDHPQSIGCIATSKALREFIASCDILLAVGTRF
jgi:acetolactate synthase-1/2/3 large subunit